MTRFFFLIIAFSIVLTSCNKSSDDNACPYTDSPAVAPSTEVDNLQTYITANYPAAIKHPSGFFYEIVATGTGATPNVCSNISFTYSGYLTNGTKFDESLTPVEFILGRLIVGWQKGLPLIRKGGQINLYIPPSLGYGNRDVRDANNNIVVPANSNLRFNLTLVDVK